jgi:hypothetical protein
MSINKKKSAIMPLKKHLNPEDGINEIDGFPVVTKYKYLGVTIDNFGSIKEHIKDI